MYHLYPLTADQTALVRIGTFSAAFPRSFFSIGTTLHADVANVIAKNVFSTFIFRETKYNIYYYRKKLTISGKDIFPQSDINNLSNI